MSKSTLEAFKGIRRLKSLELIEDNEKCLFLKKGNEDLMKTKCYLCDGYNTKCKDYLVLPFGK